jgi:EAL domain-containing protein (putative c-di-GMP-specific phosphodiesterase class I)
MEAADATAEVMRDLKRLGVGITIDDFGTGYSSLAYLRSFPIDALKVDRSFVRTLDGAPESAQIVAAVVALAHGLGLLVVAEGVEQEAQWRRLREMGCDRVQGHLFTVPVPAARCWELLRAPSLPLTAAT